MVVGNSPDFGASYAQCFAWSESANHTYSVGDPAWDDPTGSKGWSTSSNGFVAGLQPANDYDHAAADDYDHAAADDYDHAAADDYDHAAADDYDHAAADDYDHAAADDYDHAAADDYDHARDRETTTTEMTTTTTAPTTTETVPEVSVAGIQIEAPVAAQVTQATLPFTGVSTTSMAVIAAGLAAMGILLLALSRQSEERNPARSWN